MSTVIPTPRTAQLVTNPASVVWQDGSLFNGYLYLGVRLPSTGKYPNPVLWAAQRPLQIPRTIKVPIVGGIIDTVTQVFYNSDLDPPGTQYIAYWFDRLNNLIAPALSTAVPFTINATPFTLTVPTLPLPSYVGATGPDPLTTLCSTTINPSSPVNNIGFILGAVGIDLSVGDTSTIPVLTVRQNVSNWKAIFTQFPTGSSFILTVLLNGVSQGTITIPASSSGWQSGTLTAFTVNPADSLQVQVTQVGSTLPGQGLSLALY